MSAREPVAGWDASERIQRRLSEPEEQDKDKGGCGQAPPPSASVALRAVGVCSGAEADSSTSSMGLWSREVVSGGHPDSGVQSRVDLGLEPGWGSAALSACDSSWG